MYARGGERQELGRLRAGGKPATAVPTRFVLEKKSACLAPEYVFGKAQRAFTSTSEMVL